MDMIDFDWLETRHSGSQAMIVPLGAREIGDTFERRTGLGFPGERR